MQRENVVIITGGSSGIGQAAAIRFASQGCKVLITGRRSAPVEQTVAEHPNIMVTILGNLTREFSERLRHANEEIGVLE